MSEQGEEEAGKKALWIKKNSLVNIFIERLIEIRSENIQDYSPLKLGYPSNPLKSTGVPDLPIEMGVRRLIAKKITDRHPFNLLSIVDLPACLYDPIAIFQSKTRIDSKVILTDMEEKGINFVVAMEMNRFKHNGNVNDIRSIYPKDNVKEVLTWIAEENLLEYSNKEKALKWLDKQQSHSAEVIRLLESSTKVINNFINPII